MSIWTLTARYSSRNVMYYSLHIQVAVVEPYHNGICYVRNSGQNLGHLVFLFLYFIESQVILIFRKLNIRTEMVQFLNLQVDTSSLLLTVSES